VSEHDKRVAEISEKYGYSRDKVHKIIMFYFNSIKKIIQEGLDETIRMHHIGTFRPFKQRQRLIEERSVDKDKRLAKEKNDKEKHEKRLYLQRRVQAL